MSKLLSFKTKLMNSSLKTGLSLTTIAMFI